MNLSTTKHIDFQFEKVRATSEKGKANGECTVQRAESTQSLTDKQREVLDLLLEHKTSKEIARILGISPYTVDQRIAAARKKLGATTRNELAALYKSICGELVCEFSQVDSSATTGDESSGSDENPTGEKADPTLRNKAEQSVREHRVVPEIFDGRHGAWFRLAAIGLTALMLLIIGLGGMAAFAQLSDVLSY